MESVNNVKVTKNSIEMDLTKATILESNQYTSRNSDDNSDSLSISLKQIDGSDQSQNDNFMAEGFLVQNNQKQKISAKGFLTVKDLSNDSQFYQGSLYGYIYDTDGQELDEIIMSIQYDSISNKAFVSLTLGEISDEGNSLQFLDFGEIDIESNQIYFEEKLKEIKKEKARNSNRSVDSSSTMSDNEMSLLASLDNDVRLQDYTDGSGDNDDLIYLALSHCNEIRENGDTNFYIRMWADTDEAEDFYESENGGNIVSGSGHCKKGKFYIKNVEGWQAEDEGTPGNDDRTVTFPIIVWLGELSYQIFNIDFKMDSVEYDIDNVSGSKSDNKATWTFERTYGFNDNINAESNKPWDDEDDKNGLGGRVEFSYNDGHVNNVSTMSTEAYGKWYYTVVEDTGSSYYERDFSVWARLYDSIKVYAD